MDLKELFTSIKTTMLSRFKESGFIQHNGDKGENREEILMEFLANHLPKRYGVTKGEVITKDGKRSHEVDIIIYDAVNCPMLYAGKTSIFPVEGVSELLKSNLLFPKLNFWMLRQRLHLSKNLHEEIKA